MSSHSACFSQQEIHFIGCCQARDLERWNCYRPSRPNSLKHNLDTVLIFSRTRLLNKISKLTVLCWIVNLLFLKIKYSQVHFCCVNWYIGASSFTQSFQYESNLPLALLTGFYTLKSCRARPKICNAWGFYLLFLSRFFWSRYIYPPTVSSNCQLPFYPFT